MRIIILILFFSSTGYSQGMGKRGEFHDLNKAVSFPKKVKVLRLDNQDISILPDEVLQMSKLKVLTLQYNKNLNLVDVFNKLSKLPSLEELDISHCDIEQLPSEIGQLKSLKKLKLGVNKLSSIPDEIGNLSLEKLIFSQYPDDFRSFSKEKKIKLLDILPKTDILLVDYFGGVHGKFRLGKEVVRVTREELY